MRQCIRLQGSDFPFDTLRPSPSARRHTRNQEVEVMKRREFLSSLGAGVAVVSAAGGGLALGYPANEGVRVGLIGTGGRCLGELLPELKKIEGVRITAVCDVWDQNLARARKEA